MKFKVGDVVRRIYENHLGMSPGDRDVITGVNYPGSGTIQLQKYRTPDPDFPGNHDPKNFVLDQEYLNEIKIKKLLGVE